MAKARLLNIWAKLRGSLWLLPSIFTVVAFIAAEATVRIDEHLQLTYESDVPGLYPGSAEGARQVLGTLAGSMISLTTISFSVMMVVLTLASNQFGPRVLRNFLSDRFNQAVLGTFVATFVYCLLVLGQVPNPDEVGRVPRLAVSLGLLFTLGSLGMLIAFIHHVARSIQASEVVRQAYALAIGTVETVYPEELGESAPAPASEQPDRGAVAARAVAGGSSGYVQAVDVDGLMKFAREVDAHVELTVQPGDFVTKGDVVAKISAEKQLPGNVDTRVRRWLVLGQERTPEQDARYGLEQLAEIGTRALSPGINDPNTAIECIDHVGAALAKVLARKIPEQACRLEGTEYAWIPRPDFPAVAGGALDPLRHYGREHPAVIERLLRVLSTLEARTQDSGNLAWLAEQRRRIFQQLHCIEDEDARSALQRACETSRAKGAS